MTPDELLWSDAVHADIRLNELLGGKRETISAALGRKLVNGTASPAERALCAALDQVDPEHCIKAYADSPRRRTRRASCGCAHSIDDDVGEVLSHARRW